MAPMKDLVIKAITELSERGGSSLPALKKWLVANESLDMEAGPHKTALNKALKIGSEKGVFVKKGGSYKVAKVETKKKAAPKKAAGEKKPKSDKEKKPLTGYMKFVKAMRPTVLEEKPDLTFGEVGKELGARWKKLSDAQKTKYK
mmetsp:Transcript_7094/g.16223  ORF Transcript_7094/g.16223 Transcript_7094/m.16223 type:complete len:145 (-) Transcript_7094:192-626(-)|eukprot:CAMPEP_0172588212 /NCGR_PEP_ID=MMETSP1068-20121228/7144_1 /TAXON_ID=35684 /ORGANISM="Pseudopedinella elastica, Strain CCMP716" /LENGTH=144 /DNA_ID=CAMNT_0013383471 /DNA_START=139 /DNA_END=573 /DNA_ORIENTATION=-